jgi:gas vesicle protein
MGSGRVLLGFIAGAGVGALLGVLFAPDKGSVTRRKLSEQSKIYADSFLQGYNHSIAGLDRGYHSLRDTLAGFAGFARHKADDLRSYHN